jgi:cobalamin biosynthetic protein CobC
MADEQDHLDRFFRIRDKRNTMDAQDASQPLPHGGRLAEAARLFPHARTPWLDLSTGINPVAYPVPPLPAACFTRLPEPEAASALEAAAAAAYGVADADCVAAAPGTQILIDLLPRLWPQDDVAILGPTYGEHAHAWEKAGCEAAERTDFACLFDAQAAVVCNPNNPDGRRIPPADLLALADRMAGRGGLLVVDEAFADLEPAPISLAGALPHPALIVLRSFGKTYGLAGVRLGFALASAARAQAMRAALGPWAVSGPAIAIGRAALPDAAWRTATAARLADDAAALDATLAEAGLTVTGGTLLFRLAETPGATAVFDRLAGSGILVRRFDNHARRLRFGIPPDRDALERLRAALCN